jgi:hypothetical protein
MKVADTETQRMMEHYEQQLHNLGYYDTEGLDYEELKQKLTIARMKHIDYSSSANVWFE